MSEKGRSFRLTQRAETDIQNIARYTNYRWGPWQRNRYLKELFETFNWLCDHPLSGKHRADIREGYYCWQHGSHLVFYLIREDYIDIIGIPHRSMDVEDFE